MMKRVLAMLLLMLTLSACGQGAGPAEEQVDQMPTAEELGMPETMDLEFVAGEQVQAIPATLYIGQGYSLYVPDTGWRKETEWEDRIPVDVWESTTEEDVEIAVYRYGSVPLEEAVTHFLEEQDDYVFQDLLLGNGEVTEPLEGIDDDGDVLKFIIRIGTDGTYIVSWKYQNAYSSAASLAEQIVRTFVLT